jgi:predicted membrane channel-forming protein YqfA (hemolysin III family)
MLSNREQEEFEAIVRSFGPGRGSQRRVRRLSTLFVLVGTLGVLVTFTWSTGLALASIGLLGVGMWQRLAMVRYGWHAREHEHEHDDAR